MPKHSEAKTWAANHAKFMSKKAKTDTEKRRWFNLFLVLTDLVKIEIHDDEAPKTLPPSIDLDKQAREMLKRTKVKTGGDGDGIPNGQSTSS